MARIKFHSTLDGELVAKAKQKARMDGFDGTNAVIEEALRLYFANCAVEVWEKPLEGGRLQKMTVRPDKVVMECIQSRQVRTEYNPQFYTDATLEPRGWKKVWKMKRNG
ncbi:hypothetical protein [Acetonema longum]|uniref:Uncharacterized protein n=1 Tax=Acetonema longum DSM 6540 TaxID=1009370 RepID=F7NQA8_9FIRM|nr:hypothetical protein [Acetonema longum]EGO61773.1 hypothetical protein ALO_21551 [Acetonema longum DSM 6540]